MLLRSLGFYLRVGSPSTRNGGKPTSLISLRRVTAVAFTQGTKVFTYSYDAVGNRSVMQIGDGGRFSYSYDAVNQLVSILTPYTEVTTLQYDSLGQETKRTLGNGSTISFVFDTVGRNTVIEARKSDGTLHAMYTASYDAAGNRVTVLENDGAMITYSYDNTYQLTNERRSGGNAYNSTYTYDASSNRATKVTSAGTWTYTSDAAVRLTTLKPPSGSINTMTGACPERSTAVPSSSRRDNNGNVTLEQIGAVRDTDTWDTQTRLKVWNTGQFSTIQTYSGACPERSTAVPSSSQRDPDGLRVKRQLPTRTDTFLNDETNVVQVTGANPVVYEQLPGSWGSLFSNRLTSVSKFYVPDFQGHTRLLLNTSQAITDTAIYDAWGTEVLLPTTSFNDLRQWGAWGYFRDSPTAAYVRARRLRRDWGRWISADPIGLYGGMNHYGYVGNSPVVRVDPTGRLAVIGDILGPEPCFGDGLYYEPCWGQPLLDCQNRCSFHGVASCLMGTNCHGAPSYTCECKDRMDIDCTSLNNEYIENVNHQLKLCEVSVLIGTAACIAACWKWWFPGAIAACSAGCTIAFGIKLLACLNEHHAGMMRCIKYYQECQLQNH